MSYASSNPPSKYSLTWSAITRSIRSLFEGPAVSFVVTYSTPTNFTLPAGFDVSDYKGLALCQITSDSSSPSQLIVYWTAESNYRACGLTLEGTLALTAPQAQGLLSRVETPKQLWWKQLSAKELLISIAAVWTAVGVLGVPLINVFESPNALVAFSDLSPLDVVPGQQINIPVAVINGSRFTMTQVSTIDGLATTAVNPPMKILFTSNQPRLPLLPVGGSTTVQLTGTAPAPARANDAPEAFSVIASISAKTGLAHNFAPFSTSAPRIVKLWPSNVGWSSPRLYRGDGADGQPDKSAQVLIVLWAGRAYPQGYSGSISLSAPTEQVTNLSIVDVQNGATEVSSLAPINRVANFKTPPLDKFGHYSLLITIEAPISLNADQWRNLVASVSATT